MWADQVLVSDLIRTGAVAIGIAVVAALVLSPEAGDTSTVDGIGIGALAASIVAIAAIAPAKRMPDWAVGLGENSARDAASAPLAMLGWGLAAIAGVGALVAAGPLEAVFATAIALTIPAGLVISLERFLRGAKVTKAWAAARSLEWSPEADPPESTPLLREGSYTYAINACAGELAPGLAGTVMHLASVRVDESSQGDTQTTRRFTVLLASVADPGARLPLCVCAPRSRIPGYDSLDALLKRLRRIDLASAEFERRYELAIGKDGDERWVRRLFEPTFVEKLALATDTRYGWEIERGALTVYIPGYAMDEAQLERLVDLAALVANRVAAEVAETSGLEGTA